MVMFRFRLGYNNVIKNFGYSYSMVIFMLQLRYDFIITKFYLTLLHGYVLVLVTSSLR